MAEKIEYAIETRYEGEGDVRRAAAAIDRLDAKARGVGQATQGMAAGAGSALRGLATGVGVVGVAMGSLAVAAGRAYALLGEGAALVTTRERFGKLAESIGSTADEMMGKLQVATKGMIDNATLMASASQLMSLGLAKNEDQVVRLATVVGTLGWDMQQVILTFANLSTMRLDALGLSVDEVKSKQKELEKQGYSTADAFKEAVIQAGELKLAVGSLSDTEQALKQFEAFGTNAGNAFKEGFAVGASEVVAIIQEGLEGTGVEAEAAAGALGTRMGAALGKQLGVASMPFLIDDLQDRLARVLGSEDAAAEAVERITVRVNRASIAQYGWVDGLFSTEVALENQAEIINQIDELIRDLTADVGFNAGAWTQWGDNALQRAGYLPSAIDAVTMAVREMNEAFGVAAGYGAPLGWMGGPGQSTKRPTPLKPVRRGVTSDRGMMDWASDATAYEYEYKEAEAAARSYGSALSYVDEEAQKLAETHSRMMSAFQAELGADDAEGLIGADGLANVEAVNAALFRQVEAAGASAATLALLGVATGQFSAEQAEAALKAAILQEQINAIAQNVVAGKMTVEQALGSLSAAQQGVNTADLSAMVGGATEATEAVDTVGDSLAAIADETYMATLDVDIQSVLTGTDEAKRLLDAVPDLKTITINWAQAGVDVVSALRALGALP